MASAKQIAWRKKFARMSKAGKFKKSKKSNPHPKKKSERLVVEGGKVEVIETICHDWRGYLIDCETHKIIGEGYSHDPNWESLKDEDWRTV